MNRSAGRGVVPSTAASRRADDETDRPDDATHAMDASASSAAPEGSPAASGDGPLGDVPDSVLDPRTVLRTERPEAGRPAGPDGSHVLDSVASGTDGRREGDKSGLSALLFPPEGAESGSLVGVTIGHFEITKRIGRGGMGAVFKATDERLQRPVALKVLSPSLSRDPGAVKRFLNEARSAAQIDDERVARVFHCGDDGGLHYIAFEYIEGLDIRQRIRRDGRLRVGESLGLATQLAMALRATSAADVVHRDIKPSNVIVTAAGKVKLVDLGLARKPPSESVGELTVPGTTLGTFDYISPEQAKDPRDVDVRSDLYSLGCTLYHMLTGKPPYPDGTLLQKLLDHQNKSVPDPRRLAPGISEPIASLCMRLMAPDPAHRPQTAEEALDELAAAARRAGVKRVGVSYGPTRPVGPRSRVGGWTVAAGLAAAVVATLFVADSISGRKATTTDLSRFDGPASPARDVATDDTEAPPKGTGGDTPVTSPPPSAAVTVEPSAAEPVPELIVAQPGEVDGGVRPTGPAEQDFEPVTLPPGFTAGPAVGPVASTADRLDGDRKSTGSGEAEPSAAVPPPPAVEAAPTFLLLSSDGSAATAFPTLEAACVAAVDGDVIELPFDGPSRPEPLGVRLTRKTITIRAGLDADDAAKRPVVRFAPEPAASSPSGDPAAAFVIAGGGLNLFGVEVEIIATTPTAFARVAGPGRVRLEDSVVTMRGDGTLVRPAEADGTVTFREDAFGVTGPAGGGGFTLELRDCLVRGAGSLVAGTPADGGRVEADGCLVGLSDPAFRLEGGDAFDVLARLEVVSTHTTWLVPAGFVAATAGAFPAAVPAVSVTARDSVFAGDAGEFDGERDDSPALVTLTGPDDIGELEAALRWAGLGNHYGGFATWLTLTRTDGQGAVDRRYAFEDWLDRSLRSADGGGDVGARDDGLVWVLPPPLADLTRLTPGEAVLDTAAGAGLIGADGLPVGADVDALPPVGEPEEAFTLDPTVRRARS